MSSNSLGLSVEHIKKEDGVKGFGVRGFGVRGFDYSTVIVDELVSSTDTVKNNKHYRYNDQDWKGKGKGKRRKRIIK